MTVEEAKPTIFQLVADEKRELVVTEPGSYVVELNGSGAEATIISRVKLVAAETFNLKIVIHHQSARTRATTKLLGTVDGQAHLQLTGKIVIEKDCKDCESFLTERVLLLSPTAKAQVVPDLEIKNNAVHCSHAASLSYIPADQIFYLMSRGLSETQAKTEIAEAFLAQ